MQRHKSLSIKTIRVLIKCILYVKNRENRSYTFQYLDVKYLMPKGVNVSNVFHSIIDTLERRGLLKKYHNPYRHSSFITFNINNEKIAKRLGYDAKDNWVNHVYSTNQQLSFF